MRTAIFLWLFGALISVAPAKAGYDNDLRVVIEFAYTQTGKCFLFGYFGQACARDLTTLAVVDDFQTSLDDGNSCRVCRSEFEFGAKRWSLDITCGDMRLEEHPEAALLVAMTLKVAVDQVRGLLASAQPRI